MEMDDLISELMPIYLGELTEHVKSVSENLIAFEGEKDEKAKATVVEEMFRTVHSLKGASRAVALNTAASICHELENFFTAVQGGAKMDPNDFQMLFKTCDALTAMGQLVQTGDENAERRLAPLLFTLREAASRLMSSVQMDKPVPQAPDQRVEATEFAEESIKKAQARSQNNANVPGSKKNLSPTTGGVENSVRLPVAKLDNLVAESSDLITIANRNSMHLQTVQQITSKVLRWQKERKHSKHNHDADDEEGQRLRALSKELEQLTHALVNEDRHLTAAVNQVTSGVNSLRMVPIGQACQGIDRVVRDVSVASNKRIDLIYHGMGQEVDRNVLEQLRDPIMHLVRNACDHGIETVEERLAANKKPESTIKIQATTQGSQMLIAISDDGRGVSAEAVRAKAKKMGLEAPDDDNAVKSMIFTKGFSTSPIITEVSGRGIGLEIVKEKIEELHGTVEVQSVMGMGTTFTLTVPLTLTNMRVLFLKAGGQLFAISTASVQKVMRVGPEDCEIVEGRTVVSIDGKHLPVMSLAHILNMPASQRSGYKTPAVVLTAASSRAVIVAEELLSEQEVLVKNLGARIRKVKHVSGSTILPNGQIALIANAAEIVRSAINQHTQATGAPGVTRDSLKANAPRRRLLLADDSITTRSLEKSLLEAAGFEVTTCVDGAQAWQMINERQFDLVVSDVEMPRMDGFALTRRIKSSNKHMHLPVILVTALSSDRHKALGISSGADAYLVKSEFERSDLLEVINQLV